MFFYPILQRDQNASEDVLRMAFVKMFPFWDVSREPAGFRMGGPMQEVLAGIIQGVGRDPALGTPDDGQWGQRIKADPLTFNGAMGMVQRGEVDVFLGPSGIIAERLLVANPYPYYLGYTTMLVSAPDKYVDPFNYVKAFTPPVWLGIFLTWLGVSAATACLNVLRSEVFHYEQPTIEEPSSNVPRKIVEGFGLYAFRYFQYMFQSYGRKVPLVYERICLAFWLLGGVVIMALLSGELTTSLLLKDNEDFVNGVDDLLRFPGLAIVAEKGSVPERFFNSPNHPVFKRLQPRLRSQRGVMTNRTVAHDTLNQISARRAVLSAPLSFLKGLLNDRYVRDRDRCRFHIIEHHLSLTSVGMFFNKEIHPPLRRSVEKRVSYHIDSGILENALEKRMINYTKCLFREQGTDNSVEALLLSDLGGVFVLYSIGVSVSVCCMLTELAPVLFRRCVTES